MQGGRLVGQDGSELPNEVRMDSGDGAVYWFAHRR